MSLRKATNSQCRECLYDPKGGNGTWLIKSLIARLFHALYIV